MALASYNQKGKHPRAKFPPVINSIDFIGEVREDDKLPYSRTLGCSSTLGGLPIFLFTNTVAYKEPPVSTFWKIPSSTASIGSLSDPLLTHYPSTVKEGKHKRRVRQFIPFTIEEKQHNLWGQGSSDCMVDRFYLCTCSPVIEIPGEPGVGVVWFTKRKVNDSIPANDSSHGVGVAEVEIKQVDVADGEKMPVPVATRHGDVIFDDSNPQWGSVATLLHGEYIYLYGTYNNKTHYYRRFLYTEAGHRIIGSAENQVFLCRVPYANKAYLFRERYTYWDGRSFVAAPSPADGACQAKGLNLGSVIYNIQHATLFHTKLFSCTKEGLFVLIGCDKSGDGKVRFKIAENPWGPWRGEGWLIDLKMDGTWNGGDRSCVYVHLWASDLDKGEMVLTWAEPLPGGIEMARIKFEMDGKDEGDEEEQTICSGDSMLSGVERRLSQAANGRPECKAEIVDSSELVAERLEARRKTLAKLSGHLNGNRQGQPPPEQLDYSGLFNYNSFSNDYLRHNLFGRNIRFEGVDNGKSTEYWEHENCKGSVEAGILGGREMGTLTHLLRGTCNIEGEMGGTVRYAGDTLSEKGEDEEEGSLENPPGSQFPEAWNCEIHLSPTARYITYPSRGLRVMNPSPEDYSPQSNDADNEGQTGDKRVAQELATPTAVRNFSRNFVRSDTSSTPMRTIWIPHIPQAFQVPQKQEQKQKSGQFPEHQQGYWGPRNGGTGTGPLITGPDEETGMRVLGEGSRSGYEGGRYVTDLSRGDRSAPFSPQSSTESLYRALEEDENQLKYREFGTKTPTNSMKKWLFGKPLKRGIQKMIGIKGEATEEKQRGFKKKVDEMDVKRVGKSLVNLPNMKKVEKSEVNLRRFSEEQSPSMI